jgi:hypothetical protein
MYGDREIAAEALREARHVLAELILLDYVQGPSVGLDAVRCELDAEIQTLEQALYDWDQWVAGREPPDR